LWIAEKQLMKRLFSWNLQVIHEVCGAMREQGLVSLNHALRKVFDEKTLYF
jgi:hypothetical protein